MTSENCVTEPQALFVLELSQRIIFQMINLAIIFSISQLI